MYWIKSNGCYDCDWFIDSFIDWFIDLQAMNNDDRILQCCINLIKDKTADQEKQGQ